MHTVRQGMRQFRWRIFVWWRVRCLVHELRFHARAGWGPWAYGNEDGHGLWREDGWL